MIVDTQESIVTAATESNLRHQSQTEGTAFRLPYLLADFGFCAENKVNCDAVINGTYVPPDDVDCYAKEFIAALAIIDSLRSKGTIDLLVLPKEHEQA